MTTIGTPANGQAQADNGGTGECKHEWVFVSTEYTEMNNAPLQYDLFKCYHCDEVETANVLWGVPSTAHPAPLTAAGITRMQGCEGIG